MKNGSPFNCYSRYTIFDNSRGKSLKFRVESNPAYLSMDLPYQSEQLSNAVETIIGMTAAFNQEQAATCAQLLAVAWLRTDIKPDST